MNYKVINTNVNEPKYIIIATSVISPLDCIEDIQEEIGTYSGGLIFDLTFICGLASNRFLYANVNNGIIDRKTLKKIKTNCVDKKIRRIEQDFFAENPELIERATIPKAVKYQIIHKLV